MIRVRIANVSEELFLYNIGAVYPVDNFMLMDASNLLKDTGVALGKSLSEEGIDVNNLSAL